MVTRPILFSALMVRAICAGHKSQTRRVYLDRMNCTRCRGSGVIIRSPGFHGGCPAPCPDCACDVAPPVSVGDLLWVREAWRTDAALNGFKPSLLNSNSPVQYEADGKRSSNWRNDLLAGDVPGRLRPSMFMPRWASRLTLEVTDVRLCRLQTMTGDEAMAEGVVESWEIVDIKQGPNGPIEIHEDRYRVDGFEDNEPGNEDPVDAFAALWDSLNEPRGFGWEADPWVWAYSFKVHRCNVDKMEGMA